MTVTATPTTAEILQRAALRALLAPSVHNTQPWTFVLGGDSLEIRADRRRQLGVLDPRGRQLVISLGCALLHARVAIAAAGREPVVRRLPDHVRRDLVARIGVGGPFVWPGSTGLDLAIDHRRTNRRAYGGGPVPAALIDELALITRTEGAVLVPLLSERERAIVTELSRRADRLERRDRAYLAEVARWTTDDPRRPDGVQAASVPYAAPVGFPASDASPIRGFDVRGMGWLPPANGSDNAQCLLLFCAAQDDERGWLHTGEALEHAWLRLTELGYWASPLTQVIEVRQTNDELQATLGLDAYPQLLLRVGRAPETVPTRRRSARDVIVYADARPDS
ncbi:MAG TPA: hypothetical protein VHC23_09860 [Jatrophihabitans sp.]|jgi:nitroreductase|nr:hypothetical protein [Jatrophihabitans sp.]